jgi:DNA modification methylase
MTELVWEGKYDKDGRKSAPLRVALPFQTVETINESAADRQRTLSLFTEGRPTDWRNRLIWGDKKYVLPSLLPEFAGRVNLIYIDPPFDTGADFSFTTTIPDSDESFTKEPSLIEQKAYRDTWGRGLDSYLQWFYETAILLYELLHETGSIYIHIGPNINHFVRIVLDEVFGRDNHLNEIIWRRAFAHSDSRRCGIIHDAILLYTKSQTWVWNTVRQATDPEYIEMFFDQVDEATGKRYQRVSLTAPGITKDGPSGKPWRGIDPSIIGRHWAKPHDELDRLDREGRIHWPQKGVPRLKRFEDEYEGMVIQDIWTDINKIHNQALEATGYPTQKPEALIERIIKASSNEGDLVLDCFCGSGTTAAVAEKLGRRWIACDLSRFAIHTTRKRLLGIPNVRPFMVQNLGKYERQAWQAGEFGGGDGTEQAAARQRAYTEFILKLYNARAINGYTWLHGVKGGRMIHVGAVDAPVSVGDVTNIAAEFRRAIGTGKDAPKTNGVDVLGWDFAFELNEVAKQQAAAANINVRFLRIPRDVMDKRAVEQGDIKFFELAALSVDVQNKGKAVTLKLTDFVIPPDDVPEDVRQAVKHWEQWIDYWAVDWDNKGDTFHNEWQSYRTRKDKTLQKQVVHNYPEAGEYAIVVKVIDILGNDTTKTLKVRV